VSSADVPEGWLWEEVAVANGEGIIDVRGDDFESGLLVEGQPVVLHWSDCAGSVGQLLVRSRDTQGLSDRLRQLRHFAGGGLDTRLSLATQIAPLLNLFTNGSYRLNYQPAVPDCDVVEFQDWNANAPSCDGFYSCGTVLILTQRSGTLRQERVEFFQGRIAAGIRPVVLAAGVNSGFCSFVLDGHHKLQAYRALGVPPAVLFIERQDARPIPLRDGLQFFAQAQRHQQEYRRVKTTYGVVHDAEEWAECTTPWRLGRSVNGRVSDRKIRLFACACCRQLWGQWNQPTRDAVETLERFADGAANQGELASAYQVLEEARATTRTSDRLYNVCSQVAGAALPKPYCGAPVRSVPDPVVLNLIHDVFGNPFCQGRVDPTWLTWNGGTVAKLARTVYDERAYERLPILADALEEAGCTDATMLGHCRGPGQHVRGCWVLDLLLGKE
jgi:hypothetical protein